MLLEEADNPWGTGLRSFKKKDYRLNTDYLIQFVVMVLVLHGSLRTFKLLIINAG